MIRLFSPLEAVSTNRFIEECIVNKVKLFTHRKDAVWNGDWVGSGRIEVVVSMATK